MGTRRTNTPSGAPLSALKRLQDQLKWVDLVFEVRDARAPHSSGHPRAGELFGTKPRLVVLAKQDLADPVAIAGWLAELSAADHAGALALALKQARGKDKLISQALDLTAGARQARASKGILPRPMRACVVGMPNVGKSSFINWLVGKRGTQVGDRPGITRGPQWVRLNPELELLDTPGILPHTSFAEQTRLILALLNLIPDSGYDSEEVARAGLILLKDKYPGMLSKNYGGTADDQVNLSHLATLRNCLLPGGKLDERRAAQLFLNDLRSGRLGRITLDKWARQD
jgi:ribosome biogenesis GTPase A